MQVDAVILAGGNASRVDPKKQGLKSLLKLGAKPLISYVISSLEQTAAVKKIIIVCPPGAKESFSTFGHQVLEVGGSLMGKIATAFKLTDTEMVLVASSDIPFITAAMVEKFLAACSESDVDFYYPIVPKDLTERKFPQTKRTYLKLTDGVFTGGNIHLIKKDAFLKNINLAEKVFSLRKSPIGLLGLLGWRFVLKFFLGRLTIKELEAKAGALLAAKVKAVICDDPEIGVDIDKPEDWQMAHAYLSLTANTDSKVTSTS